MPSPTAGGIATIDDPDPSELGPAMLKLNAAQRRFVIAMVEVGGNQRRCALAAGYKANPESPTTLTNTACRLAHDEKIQEAMLEVGLRMLGAARIPTIKFVLDTILDESAERKDRLRAAQMVMDRTGLHAMSEHKVAVTHKDETSAQLIKEITQLSKVLGVDPKKLLGANTVDAEFEEVTDECLKGEEETDDLADLF